MPSRKVIAFGHSHMGALDVAFKEVSGRRRPFDLVTYQFLRADRPHIVNIGGRWCYNPECSSELLNLIEEVNPDLLVVMLQGEQGIAAGLTAPLRPFDFFFPGEERRDRDEGCDIIPFDILFDTCMGQYRLISDLLDLLRARYSTPALALCPPPPVGDSQFILSQSLEYAGISKHISKYGLPPAAWRYGIWKLHVSVLRTIYQEHGVRFIDPPEGSFGKDGCLRSEFWSDVFHANTVYGHLLLQQVCRLINNQPA